MFIFPNLREYIQLLPVSIVGILSGFIRYYSGEKRNLKEALKMIFTVIFLTLIAYSILTAVDLPYLARVGISVFVGHFGVDKAIELVQKIMSVKKP